MALTQNYKFAKFAPKTEIYSFFYKNTLYKNIEAQIW